jgi:hypothetical protein
VIAAEMIKFSAIFAHRMIAGEMTRTTRNCSRKLKLATDGMIPGNL